MSEVEIELARAYLRSSGQDPVAALIRSVRDIARMRRLQAAWVGGGENRRREELIWPDAGSEREAADV